ncbi:glutamyl-Q tRNA(Asp) synthetase [Sphingomonas vulcanisoli]|uniref:Glutamyl-Q tRNA(Asp) synthetase n=1 Tax=Sphingomonas vulcanisoli TaxID=1658060 RepID=A0ABX0TQL9_9SPHN|nr:glutamyl-Q tRNA(Asp) synthetase [Sphingomonas vulcanisoli]NIJ07383.1 glutamyl-Q tRNA(Asp) synthetase [Sphingomonas vulcanisoli]
MTIVSRFAPSPTGRLHLGHAYSALKAHDYARGAGGQFLLRIEDIDPGRTREEFVAGIIEDLRWLGIDWDGEVVRQSERLPLYADALERLKAMELVYPCFCSRAEIAASAAAPHGDEGPVYPGTCRALRPDERDLSKPHCWRLDMAAAMRASTPSPLVGEGWGEGCAMAPAELYAIECGNPSPNPLPQGERALTWHEASTGWIAANPLPQGDIILARKDAPTSYHLAVTVDDAAQGVTDIVRGQDLFVATHVHRLLQALLGLPTPRYHHHPLLTDATGQRLAKRRNSPSLADLRAQGADPAELAASLRADRLPIGFGLAQA